MVTLLLLPIYLNPCHQLNCILMSSAFSTRIFEMFRYERSTDQVVRPIYSDALYSWVGQIPSDVEDELLVIAPMLIQFGYVNSTV